MQCDSPHFVQRSDVYSSKGHLVSDGNEGHFVPVPCGKCPNCKRNRVAAWQFRLMQEDKVSLCSHFITLTYDTEFVPISDNGFPTLVSTVMKKNKKGKLVSLPHPLSFQAFMKRLRKHFPDQNLKYYCAGEYGEARRRPHYHAILFNCTDIEKVHQEWKFGAVHVGDVTKNSVGYTAKYINKEKRIPEFPNDDRIKEFSLMSKGLGKSYSDSKAVKNYHKSDLERNYLTIEGGVKIPLPRYYREKIYDSDERLKQREIIEARALEAEEKALLENGGDIDALDARNEEARRGRYKSFYNHIKQNRK